MADKRWKLQYNVLNEVFFGDDKIIKRASEEFKEFWSFVEKYENARAKRSLDIGKKKGSSSEFDRLKRLNIALDYKEFVKRYKEFKKIRHIDEEKDSLSKEEIKEFGNIILFFKDFQQKSNFSKIAKLRRDQENLPIRQYKDQIIHAVQYFQAVIIAGDTGCGKSTQVPQYLMSAGFQKIACTQPRRIACISLAKRVGYETLNEYGSQVAYQVRFDASKTQLTRILFLTEGLLLRQLQTDPQLKQYSVIVVDEVHERHINGDFLLGVLRCLLEQRKDLKLVLMSATINISLFASYFEGAPVVHVPGRLFSIDMQYLPHFLEAREKNDRSERLDPSPYLRIMQLIDNKYPSSERGDLLIFMSGMAEIEAVVDAASEYAQKTKRWIILPLHSSLSIEDQDKVFDIAPEGVRKCIVSTNIAETSITIDGIRFIADSGKVKEMSFDNQLKMQRLQEFWISQASAEQRKGRAGRTGPGVCFRLYSREDYSAFAEYSTPEIQRVPLDNLVLQMANLGLRDPMKFPFIESPPKSSLEGATFFLKQQNALSEEGCLTPIGKMLAQLPVDVVVGKMLIMGTLFDMVEPVLIIAAALSVQSPFTRRIGDEYQVDVDHRRSELQSEHGDPFTLLNVYDQWIRLKADRQSSTRKWCKRRGIEEERLYEISKLKRQFERLLSDYKLVERKSSDKKSDEELKKFAGEKRRLVDLKREYHQQTRKRKVLKLYEKKEEDSDEDDDKIDIQAVQFELTHNLSKLQRSITNRDFSYLEVNILKIIICSGLYPQVAVADESNPWKRVSDMAFHSKEKQFLSLHPSSVYAAKPELLIQDQAEIKGKTEGRLENNKELLAFVSLLETNKPYIVNSMRTPMLQTLLLFSRNLDTNSDFTRVVCDGWIDIGFKDGSTAQRLLSDLVKLRSAWERLLEIRLSLVERQENHFENDHVMRLQRSVSRKLAEFIDSNIKYTQRRVLSSESGYLYVASFGRDEDKGAGEDQIDVGETESTEETAKVKLDLFGYSDGVPHPTKGGVRVTEYLTYACLRDDLSVAVAQGQAEFLREHYHCATCGAHLICNVLERLKHDSECQSNQNTNEDTHSIKKTSDEDKAYTTSKDEEAKSPQTAAIVPKATVIPKTKYLCTVCEKEFDFTPVEVLKHKRSHR
eukprot:gene12353-3006_t